MSYRFWIFAAAALGMLAVLAGSVGAHAMRGYPTEAIRVYDAALRYHIMHVPALLAVAWLASLDARRSTGGSWLTQLAGIAFLAGVALFSGTLVPADRLRPSRSACRCRRSGGFCSDLWLGGDGAVAFGLPDLRRRGPREGGDSDE